MKKPVIKDRYSGITSKKGNITMSELDELEQILKKRTPDWKGIVVQCVETTMSESERILKGLTTEELNWQPKPDCNSIGWTAWHITRALDAVISTITGEEQLWIKDGWCVKFNRPTDPTDTGGRHTPEQVAAFKITDIDTLLDYCRVAHEKANKCLAELDSSDLDRKIDDEWSQLLPTVGSRLVITIVDVLEHAGQMAYVRGLRQGKGWQEF